MDYREMYFELFRRQTDAIEILERLIDELKIGHLTTEEMAIGAQDGAEDAEEQ
ncbi:MAG: hypothetical protein FWC62_03615 [Firmicutes bacterium]|nr:hypothetical protein [Bacillota bacterium]